MAPDPRRHRPGRRRRACPEAWRVEAKALGAAGATGSALQARCGSTERLSDRRYHRSRPTSSGQPGHCGVGARPERCPACGQSERVAAERRTGRRAATLQASPGERSRPIQLATPAVRALETKRGPPAQMTPRDAAGEPPTDLQTSRRQQPALANLTATALKATGTTRWAAGEDAMSPLSRRGGSRSTGLLALALNPAGHAGASRQSPLTGREGRRNGPRLSLAKARGSAREPGQGGAETTSGRVNAPCLPTGDSRPTSPGYPANRPCNGVLWRSPDAAFAAEANGRQ